MNKSRQLQIILGLALVLIAGSTVRGQVRITEYMYQGINGEFVELTNTGGSAVDMTGWSLDDNTNTPGSFDLTAFGSVAAGES